VGVSALNHTLALGILRGLSEFCGKEKTAKLQSTQKERKDLTADGRRYTQMGISERIAKTKTELEDLLLRFSVSVAFC
jgi:hypothetical protein